LGRSHFATNVDYHFKDDSPVSARIDRLVGSDANWVRHHSKRLSQLKPGDRGIVVDLLDREIGLVEVIDTTKDGKAWVFSYDALDSKTSNLRWNNAQRAHVAKWASVGKGRGVRTSFIDYAAFAQIKKELTRRFRKTSL
jgi:hypothetical protein